MSLSLLACRTVVCQKKLNLYPPNFYCYNTVRLTHFTNMFLKSQKCHLQFGDGNRTQARSPVKTDHYEQMLHEKRREEAQRRYPIYREYQVCIFWYQVYEARLRERMLNRSASLAMSTSILQALPGKLDIKRREPGFLFISLPSWFTLQTREYYVMIDFFVLIHHHWRRH